MFSLRTHVYSNTTVAYKYNARRYDEQRGALTKSVAIWGLNGAAQYTSAPSDWIFLIIFLVAPLAIVILCLWIIHRNNIIFYCIYFSI